MNIGDLDRDKLEQALKLVSSWDFTLTKEKLLEPSYAGWTIERANAAEKDYKRYMAITVALGGQQLVPNGDIDRFWHEHILDTRRYAKDCFDLFGGFLHHYPYFGMRGEADNKNWIDAAQASNDLWSREFGEELYTVPNEEAAGPSPMKCPQACPNPAMEMAAGPSPMKCPQACPNPAMEMAVPTPMKCPQACPNPAMEMAVPTPMKCPQACPNPAMEMAATTPPEYQPAIQPPNPVVQRRLLAGSQKPRACPTGFESTPNIDASYPFQPAEDEAKEQLLKDEEKPEE